MASNVNDIAERGNDPHFQVKETNAFGTHEVKEPYHDPHKVDDFSNEKISSASRTPTSEPAVLEVDSEKGIKDTDYREKEINGTPASFSEGEGEREQPSVIRKIWNMAKPFFFPVFWLLMTGYEISISFSPRVYLSYVTKPAP